MEVLTTQFGQVGLKVERDCLNIVFERRERLFERRKRLFERRKRLFERER